MVRRLLLCLLLGLVGWGAAPPVSAQTLGWGLVPNVHDGGASDLVVMVEGNAGVAIRDGRVQPILNGDPAPPERVVRYGEDFAVRHAEGQTLAEVAIQLEPAAGGPRLEWVWMPRPYSTASLSRLGVTVRGLTDAEAAAIDRSRDGAVRVTDTVPGSPAAEAGLRPGDVIADVGAQDRATPLRLRQAARRSEPISLAVVRPDEPGPQRLYLMPRKRPMP